MNRRDFLGGLAAIPASMGVAWAAPEPGRYANLFIAIELNGGNDGLNTVVPFASEHYYSIRPRLAIKREQVLALSDQVGLHPALAPLLPLWEANKLAVVQGVGYPQPNLSHFRSIEIWDTASSANDYLADGWLTRAFVRTPPPRQLLADGVVVGAGELGPLAGSGARVLSIPSTAQFLNQSRLAGPGGVSKNPALAHILAVEQEINNARLRLGKRREFKVTFPVGGFGNAVRTAAELAAQEPGVVALQLTLSGFDTHVNQLPQHARLMGELAAGLVALKDALVEAGRWESALVMTYAEFGRRPRENGSQGTDHGTANSHFVMGGAVKGGLYGQPPQLDRLDGNGNLAHGVDFRSLYATVLERWWRVPSAQVLSGRFAPLDFLAA